MNSSFLYHAWGLYSLECTKEEYKGNKIILHVQSKKRLSVCPKCGKSHLVKNGYRFRDFIGLPIGGKKVIIRMKVQRYKCKNEECDFDQQHKTRLDNALAMNEPLSKAYYLKEQLKEIWSQISKEEAEAVLDDWVKQARESFNVGKSLRYWFYCQMSLVAGGLDLIAGQHIAGRTAYACGVVVQVQGDAVLLLQLVGIYRLRQVVGAVVVGVEVERLIHRKAQSQSRFIAHGKPAVVAPQAAVLWNEVGFEHIVHIVLIDADGIAGLAVWIVLLRSTAVPLHLLQRVDERHGQSDAGQESRHRAFGLKDVMQGDGSVAVDAVFIDLREA